MLKIIFLFLFWNTTHSLAMQSPRIPEAQWRVEDYPSNYHVEISRKILSQLQREIKDAKNVWHCGCKNGAVTKVLQEYIAPGAEVWATEHPSAHLLVNLAAKEYSGVRYVCSDYPVYNSSYDLIFSLHHLHWIKDKKQFLNSIYETLARDGLALIVMRHIEAPENPIAEWQALIPAIFKYVPHGVELDNDLIGMYAVHDDEMMKLVEETGFEQISIGTFEHTFCLRSEQEFYHLSRPSFMSRPIVQYVEDAEERENLFLDMVGNAPELVDIRENGKTECTVSYMVTKLRK